MKSTDVQWTDRSSSLRGVTLVEILIVVCIALLLVALFLPSMGKFIRAGGGAKCVQNLKQLQFAFQSFVADSNGALPDNNRNDCFPISTSRRRASIGIPSIRVPPCSKAGSPDQWMSITATTGSICTPPPKSQLRKTTSTSASNTPAR